MARTKRSADLGTRNKRLDLPQGQPHTETLSKGKYLLYRRPMNGASGVWSARWRNPDTGKMLRNPLGSADDFLDANGIDILNFAQAQKAAEQWFTERARVAHLESTGEVVNDKPFTVADALADLLAQIRRDGRPDETVESYTRTRINPALGEIEVAKLTMKRLKDWHSDLAKSPRWVTGQRCSQQVTEWKAEPSEDQLRSRKSSANRILAILKRALNYAVEEGRYAGATPWRDVKPHKGVAKARLRFLSLPEQMRLIKACPPGLRELIVAGLHTGSRYAPLTRLKVKDFNAGSSQIFIEKDKGVDGGKARWVILSEDAVKWFRSQVKGKDPEELMFRNAGVTRMTREGDAWMSHDVSYILEKALTKAGFSELDRKEISFYTLRHSYASGLVNAGVPLSYVAAQLGHVDTRMVEKHYGHLCPDAKAASIRSLAPRLKV